MAAKLTEELQKALQEQAGRPLEVVDPATSKVYLLIEREQYDRLRPLFEHDPLTNEEQRHLLQQAGKRAGWDDPEMDAYDSYDEHRSEKP